MGVSEVRLRYKNIYFKMFLNPVCVIIYCFEKPHQKNPRLCCKIYLISPPPPPLFAFKSLRTLFAHEVYMLRFGGHFLLVSTIRRVPHHKRRFPSTFQRVLLKSVIFSSLAPKVVVRSIRSFVQDMKSNQPEVLRRLSQPRIQCQLH